MLGGGARRACPPRPPRSAGRTARHPAAGSRRRLPSRSGTGRVPMLEREAQIAVWPGQLAEQRVHGPPAHRPPRAGRGRSGRRRHDSTFICVKRGVVAGMTILSTSAVLGHRRSTTATSFSASRLFSDGRCRSGNAAGHQKPMPAERHEPQRPSGQRPRAEGRRSRLATGAAQRWYRAIGTLAHSNRSRYRSREPCPYERSSATNGRQRPRRSVDPSSSGAFRRPPDASCQVAGRAVNHKVHSCWDSDD
jgi:hypothetical protein